MNSFKHFFCLAIFGAGLALQLPAQTGKTPLPSIDSHTFNNPPKQYGVHSWWHWMDNSISKEGITADLEAMEAQGIVTVTILNVSLLGEEDFGFSQVKFRSPEWFDMFRWALSEADRLGLRVGVHNCDGWSTTGGSWITPELSMKEATWRAIAVRGGKRVSQTISKPVSRMNYYRDVAVVAYKIPEPLTPGVIVPNEVLVNEKPVINELNDGNPMTGLSINGNNTVDLVFENPVPYDEVMIHFQKTYLWRNMGDIKVSGNMLVSDDGKNFRHLQSITGYPVNKCMNIKLPQGTLKALRLQIDSVENNASFGPVQLTEMNVLNKGKALYQSGIPAHLAKIVASKATGMSDFTANPVPHDFPAVNMKDILDITDKMDADGRLVWDAPEGNWKIIRFGYTTTGATNYPATRAGRGLECDKMDRKALKVHFDHFPMELVQAAGNYTGNTFEYIFVDSWECKFQNWTENFKEAFHQRQGYSIVPFIPALCGTVVENATVTDNFFHDFQKTIAGLLEDEYYIPFRDLCNEQGLELSAETIYGGPNYPPLDVLKSNTYAQNPMLEYWARANDEKIVRYQPVRSIERDLPVQAAAIYNERVVSAEAYTGFISYSEDPWDLKLYGDNAMCAGINRMVLHSYVHQPVEAKPGFTLGIFGHSFNRHNPWFKDSGEWFKYLARAQYILQETVPYGEVLQWIGDAPHQIQLFDELNNISKGINRHICNTDILANQAYVDNGHIMLANGQRYKMLILPKTDAIQLESLKAIEKLVGKGATVYGAKPTRLLSNSGYEKNLAEMQAIADRLWGNASGDKAGTNNYGKGKVMWGISLSEALDAVEVKADFKQLTTGSVPLMYYHKVADGRHVFFIVNQEDEPVYGEGAFHLTGKSVELWCPETGEVKKRGMYAEEEGYTKVPLHLKARQAVFVVFDVTPQRHISKAFRDGKQIFPAAGQLNEDMPDISVIDGQLTVVSPDPSRYGFMTDQGTKIQMDAKGVQEWPVDRMEVKIAFEDRDAGPLRTNGLDWLNNHHDPRIKYFSGTASYTISFNLPDSVFSKAGEHLFLGIEEFASTCELVLNGQSIGKFIFQDRPVKIAKDLLKRENILEVKVSNNWRNRIIGDLRESGKINVFTTALVGYLPTGEMPLTNMGLKGKIRLIYPQPQIIDL